MTQDFINKVEESFVTLSKKNGKFGIYDELVKEKEQDEYQNWWVYLEKTHANEDNTEVLVWEVVNTYCKNKVSYSHPDEDLTNE